MTYNKAEFAIKLEYFKKLKSFAKLKGRIPKIVTPAKTNLLTVNRSSFKEGDKSRILSVKKFPKIIKKNEKQA